MCVSKTQVANDHMQDVYAANEPQVGHMSGKSVVIIDASRADRKGFVAGNAKTDRLWSILILIGCLAISVLAAFCVGIATADLKPALKTLAVGVSCSFMIKLGLYLYDPKL